MAKSTSKAISGAGGAVSGGGGGIIGSISGGIESATGMGGKSQGAFFIDPILGHIVHGKESAEQAQKEQEERYNKGIEKIAGMGPTTSDTTTTNNSTSTTTGGTTTESVSKTTFDPKSKKEKKLQDQSIANYNKQQKLVGQQEKGIQDRLGLQTDARDTSRDILGGGAFDLTSGEQGRIDAFRDSSLDLGESRINNLLDQRLGDLRADAASRGLRGQALTQLETGAMNTAAQQMNEQILAANQTAAGQAIDMPGQRVGIQAGVAGQNTGFADALQQQAIDNRQQLQDPVALQQMLEERLKGGTTSTTGSTDTNQTVSNTGTQSSSTTGNQVQQQGMIDLIKGNAGMAGPNAAGDAGAMAGHDKGVGIAGQIFGGVMQGLSDRTTKKEVAGADKGMSVALKHLKPYFFQYKGEYAPPGDRNSQHVGVMAQDLQESIAGASIVKSGPGGVRHIDHARAVNFLLAAVAHLSARVEELEAKDGERS